MTTLSADILRWVERSTGPSARVVAVDELPPSSTEKHRIELDDGGESTRVLVLRRYHDTERLATDFAYVPANEAEALRILGPTDVPAPSLIAVDLAPEICDVPAILETWVPGRSSFVPFGGVDLERFVRRPAAVLVEIHAVRGGESLPACRRYAEDGAPAIPPWSPRPRTWERVLSIVLAEPPSDRPRFIHRDFHGGNVLWADAEVSGVVDWATACIGPAGIDLARMRLNLASDIGAEAADAFRRAYVEAGGDDGARHPYWDLVDVCDRLTDLSAPADAGEVAAWARFESWAASVAAELG
ncbi:MAG TPA: aminoglycoside phosphotransferase family protein [Actinomycetota bacterium]